MDMARISITLLLLLTNSGLNNALMVPSRPYKNHHSLQLNSHIHDEEEINHRRSFLTSSLGLVLANVAFSSSAFAEGEDPFSKMDSIAAKIGNNSGYPNSISPLPTFKETEKELVADDEKAEKSTVSEMEEALKTVRKEKRIDPRTHG